MFHYRLLTAALLCGGTAFAQSAQSIQSEAEAILRATQAMPSASASASQSVFAIPPAQAGQPAVQSTVTVIGDNVANSGVPCFDCVSGALGYTIGLVSPDGNLHADGTTSYAFNNFSWDNTYTGNCEFTFLVRDAAKNYILKLGPFTFPGNPGTGYLTSTAGVLPNSSAAAGFGAALTVTQCGTVKAVTSMPTYISYP